ncbi:uncharacterized protein LOC121769062 [Salvia splendens]|uniref:uncharacterized protein LOC121769062 n=1 Tax=Salvia splendens TaxID=180675 RepID=UPI001100C443|nr:uncharacterized protein LOC121769062 [Salvia splendens]XP_042021665.1 uncharacterized protein LOC121769062 [Salvia splendens]
MGIVEGSRHHSNCSQKNSIVDSRDDATQQIESLFSPGDALEGDRDDASLNIMSMPVDDTYILEDEFETQMANLAEETQVVDLAEETQVVDLTRDTQVVDLTGDTQVVDLTGDTQVVDIPRDTQVVDLDGDTLSMDLDGETQMVDFADKTQLVDLYEETQVVDLPGETQVLDEFNAELYLAICRQTNKTDVTCETQRLSEEPSAKIDGNVSIELDSAVDKNSPKEESPCRGFTSIRAASIRASGLAARARGASLGLSTTSTDKSSMEHQTSELDGPSLIGHVSKSLENSYSNESEGNPNRYKITSTAVRRLFREDEDAECEKAETETNQTDYMLEVLSYVDSQEPGDLSQERALEVVNRFLDVSFIEHDEDFGKKVQDVNKPKGISAVKGSRDLAKRSTLQKTTGERGIYDWDDAREDDGGGEFFLKKRELFFDNVGPVPRCLTEPRKPRSVVESDKKMKADSKSRQGDLVHSDLGLLHKTRPKQKSLHGEEVVSKNITRNLEEQLHEVSGPELADNCEDKNIPDDIGPDTQMAAEAMGDLCFQVHLSDSNKSGNKAVSSTRKDTTQNKFRNSTVHSEEDLPYFTRVGVVTRQTKRTKRISTRNSTMSSLAPVQCKITKKRDDGVLREAEQRRSTVENVSSHNGAKLTGERSEKFSVPVQTSIKLDCPKVPSNSVNAKDEINKQVSARASGKRKNAVTMTIEDVRRIGLTRLKQSNRACLDKSSTPDIDAVSNLQGIRSRQETSADAQHSRWLTRSSKVAVSIRTNLDKDSSNQLPPRSDSEPRKIISRKTAKAKNSRNDAAVCGNDRSNKKSISADAVGLNTSKQGDEKDYDGAHAGGGERNGRQEASPRCGTSYSTCATPTTRAALRHDVSPICKGDEYHKQSCRKNQSVIALMKELDDLHTGSPEPCSGMRGSRKRKDITTIRVLFSQHLDVDVVKQQKKILARLGGGVASSVLEATHFIADEFVRTRNMLEAIASGKPVVTRSWIESCGQASCLIDEKNYILRDAKKEKEFGFCLPVSLARASQHPLLLGQKVFVTPNTKPGKDILVNLVKAVHGMPVERLGRSVFKAEQLPDDLLVLSCEEDYDACLPFLEKGGTIYSSELLLNGIVKQKLEYERHGLFADHVKRTRSTMWLKKTNKFLPVTK